MRVPHSPQGGSELSAPGGVDHPSLLLHPFTCSVNPGEIAEYTFAAVGAVASASGVAAGVSGWVKNRRIAQDNQEKASLDEREDWARWRRTTTEDIHGRLPSRNDQGWIGLVDRANRLDDRVFGKHDSTLEATGADE